ncbi:MAG: DnaJ domain-containing protein [Candidatus Methanoperedens sp.]|nr:DnaJ domain-containing protein [Candidatus Methanoperedens sp.]
MNDQIDEIRTEIEREKTARDILGIDYNADEIEIKKKYWLLAMETHPDLNPYDKERENRFRIISEAYEYLTTRKCGSRYTFFRNGTVKYKDSVIIYNEAGYLKWWKMAFF